MPTAKPRITITLSDEQHSTLQALAVLQSVSMSSIIVDLLDTALPVFQRLFDVLNNASQAPQAVLDSFKASLMQAEEGMLGHQDAVLNQLDLLVGLSGAKGVDAASVRREEKPVAEAKPPTSNRGVRNVPPTSKNRSISPSKSKASVNSNGRAKK